MSEYEFRTFVRNAYNTYLKTRTRGEFARSIKEQSPSPFFPSFDDCFMLWEAFDIVTEQYYPFINVLAKEAHSGN